MTLFSVKIKNVAMFQPLKAPGTLTDQLSFGIAIHFFCIDIKYRKIAAVKMIIFSMDHFRNATEF